MKLKNYTSSVSVERSTAIIESLLVKCGATHTAKFYDGGRLSGFIFQMPVDGRALTFKLPADPQAVLRVMKSEIKKPHRDTIQRIESQAERTAWKILAEWVHIQITMIQMHQAEAIQIFLPYAYDGQHTFYEKLKENQFRQLIPHKQGDQPK
jgi:hypothetical protein